MMSEVDYDYTLPSIEQTSTNPASRVQIHAVSLAHRLEVEVKRWVRLVAHPVGWVALERIAGMDQVPW